MDLGHLKFAEGSKKKRKRIGRGPGSGHGKTSCRGHKGQGSRSGSKSRAWFEGGQMPLQRRIPKRGFTNIFKRNFDIVNLKDIAGLKDSKISPEDLVKARLVGKRFERIKILGDGEIGKSVEISAHAFTKSAVEKIEAAGGKAIVL
ncbi:50S ribosomal protein L15 [bacterium I07]|nr:50S ribosomal protein L15 [bacterium I07]